MRFLLLFTLALLLNASCAGTVSTFAIDSSHIEGSAITDIDISIFDGNELKHIKVSNSKFKAIHGVSSGYYGVLFFTKKGFYPKSVIFKTSEKPLILHSIKLEQLRNFKKGVLTGVIYKPIRGGKLIELEKREKESTGISSLKVGYNKIFGYYIEVTKANLELVPETYIRKQTLVGGERFITPELKEYESKVIGAEEKLKNLEYQVFNEILTKIQDESQSLSKTANCIASIDFLLSMAVVAKRHNYIKPVVDESDVINILDGRHPVLERIPLEERFIPNNVYLNNEDQRLLIITGPNMAGKSTYMRQIALTVLMAQIGSFVPASEARIGVVDRIFTRIGASDFITKGQSTFMVEMIETANILNNASSQSLIIIDEVGRGTSTFDGISIAWAVAEHIAKFIKAKTLFATHYNELTELALTLDGVKNYNISVKEWGDEIIFLRKVEEGPADKSYGIQVARLAGLPSEVIARAKEVLTNLEKEELNEAGEPKFASKKKRKGVQLDLFSVMSEPLLAEIMRLDTETLTPQDALNKIKEFKNKITS